MTKRPQLCPKFLLSYLFIYKQLKDGGRIEVSKLLCFSLSYDKELVKSL